MILASIMRYAMIAVICGLCMVGVILSLGCGGGGVDGQEEPEEVEVVEEEQPAQSNEPEFVNKYYWPFQCPDEADVLAFYDALKRDKGTYPRKEIPQGTVVYLAEDTEDFRTAVGMCLEALNWALPDEYDLTFSEQTVPSGDYSQDPPPSGAIYVDINQELIEWYWEHHHPLAEALASPRYVVLSEHTLGGKTLYRADTVCHELMHVLGFWGHPNRDTPPAEIYSILGAPDGCNVGGSTEDGIVPGWYHPDYSHLVECALGRTPGQEYPPGIKTVSYQSTFGPHTLLTPIDAMALRKLYGGNDVESWARGQNLYPADCPEE